MKIIKLTKICGTEPDIYINFDHVAYFQREGNVTAIHFKHVSDSAWSIIVVKEAPEEIVRELYKLESEAGK